MSDMRDGSGERQRWPAQGREATIYEKQQQQ